MYDPIGVVLAGGASSRMGADKAFVEVADVPMISWVVRALEQVVAGGILISGREGTVLGYPGIPDRYGDHAGPLAGLATILERAQPTQSLVVVAVDHPFVRTETLQGLVRRFDGSRAVVPVADGIRQVTVAVYAGSLAGTAAAAVADGGSLQSLLDHVGVDEVAAADWQEWGEDGRSWFSVDSVEAVADGLEAFGPPSR